MDYNKEKCKDWEDLTSSEKIERLSNVLELALEEINKLNKTIDNFNNHIHANGNIYFKDYNLLLKSINFCDNMLNRKQI